MLEFSLRKELSRKPDSQSTDTELQLDYQGLLIQYQLTIRALIATNNALKVTVDKLQSNLEDTAKIAEARKKELADSLTIKELSEMLNSQISTRQMAFELLRRLRDDKMKGGSGPIFIQKIKEVKVPVPVETIRYVEVPVFRDQQPEETDDLYKSDEIYKSSPNIFYKPADTKGSFQVRQNSASTMCTLNNKSNCSNFASEREIKLGTDKNELNKYQQSASMRQIPPNKGKTATDNQGRPLKKRFYGPKQ